MRGTLNGTTTFYPGRHYNKEIAPGGVKVQKFYFAGAVTIAVRTLGDGTDVLHWVLSDHLGSTSITANADGTLHSVIQYTAFGEIRSTQGNTPTQYRYTGQLAQAELGLDYYVARFYDPLTGHFTQADTLIPEPGKASAFDRYAYVLNNPIRYNDPTGYITEEEEEEAEKILKELSRYQVRIKKDWGKKEKNWEEGFWTIDDMQKLLSSIEDLSIAMGGIDEFNKNLGGVTFSQEKMESGGLGFAHNVILNSSDFSKWTVVHELGHAWDLSNRENLSRDMSISLSAGFRNPILHLLYPENSKYWYDPGNGPPPCGIDTNFNSREDFAESVAAYVYPDKALNNATIRGWPYSDQNRGYSFSSFSETPRGRYIDALIVSRK